MLSFAPSCGMHADWQCWAGERQAFPDPWSYSKGPSRVGLWDFGFYEALRPLGVQKAKVSQAVPPKPSKLKEFFIGVWLQSVEKETLVPGLILCKYNKYFFPLSRKHTESKMNYYYFGINSNALWVRSQLAVWKIGLIRHREISD